MPPQHLCDKDEFDHLKKEDVCFLMEDLEELKDFFQELFLNKNFAKEKIENSRKLFNQSTDGYRLISNHVKQLLEMKTPSN